MGRRTVLACILCAVSTASVLPRAQSQPPASQQETVFRAAIDAVQLDVIVVDRNGRPVTGLTMDDFEVLENRQLRPITTFSEVAVPSVPFDEAFGDVEADVADNTLPEGRLYVFALDEVSPEGALRARLFLRDFIERHFSANDVAAVVLVGRGLAATGQDLTSSRTRLLAAIDRFSGGFPDPGDLELRRINQMSALRALVEALATIPGRRKAVLYITESVSVDMLDIIDYSGRARTLEEFCRLVPERGVKQSCRPSQYAHAMLVAAHHGNVAFYPIDPRGLLTSYTSPADTRRSLADVTGGVAIVSRNNIAEGLGRIVQDNASYYLIGYDSAYSGRVGRFVNVDLRVKRPGLQVQVREGYVTPFPEERTLLDQPRPDASVANALANVISVPAVSMQAFVTAYKGEGSRAVVPVVVEIDASTLALTQVDGRYEGDLELRHLATDVRSRVHGEARHSTKIALAAGPDGELPPNTTVRMISAMDLPPGRYQVRVAAGTPGRAGSVLTDLEVPDFTDGALAMSGVAISSLRGDGTMTVHVASPIGDDLPVPPTTVRRFERSDEIAVSFEIYSNRSRLPPHTLVARAEIRRADGTVVLVGSQSRSSTAQLQPSSRPFMLRLPLADAPPGRYLLHVEVQSDARRRPDVVSRAIPIEVR